MPRHPIVANTKSQGIKPPKRLNDLVSEVFSVFRLSQGEATARIGPAAARQGFAGFW